MKSVNTIKPKVLIPEIKIQTRLRELAHDIQNDFQGEEITAICILKGSFIFFSDLIRLLEIPVRCEFLGLSSYGDHTVSTGEVKVTLDLNDPLEDRNVIIFEDIVDTGLTLKFILQQLQNRKPKSVKTCSLLVKPQSLKVKVPLDYVGFEVGNEFIVGYGLDYAQKFRGLPYIGAIETSQNN